MTLESGAPQVVRPSKPVSLSLSHARGLVAVAVATPVGNTATAPRIGIDVERFDRRAVDPGLARHAFSAAEADALSALPEAQYQSAFLRLWTAKEAACKLAGLGLGLGLTRPRITEPATVAALGSIEITGEGPDQGARWVLWRPVEVSEQDLGGSLALAVETVHPETLRVDHQHFRSDQIADPAFWQDLTAVTDTPSDDPHTVSSHSQTHGVA